MEQFITWDMLLTYTSFVTVVFMMVEFTKEIKYIKNIPTKYLSAIISFILMIAVNIHSLTFSFADVIIYILTSISISLGANGLSNFNKKKRVSNYE